MIATVVLAALVAAAPATAPLPAVSITGACVRDGFRPDGGDVRRCRPRRDLARSGCADRPILADSRDAAMLDATSGPLRIVAPCDLTHARWVHGVASLEIVVVPGVAGAHEAH